MMCLSDTPHTMYNVIDRTRQVRQRVYFGGAMLSASDVLTSPSHKTLRDWVFECLRTSIVSGDLAPGQRIGGQLRTQLWALTPRGTRRLRCALMSRLLPLHTYSCGVEYTTRWYVTVSVAPMGFVVPPRTWRRTGVPKTSGSPRSYRLQLCMLFLL